ncbi:MAG: stage 0 sporulation family protein [Oscillospiraceae bacterium]|nr:stage 0 sporulation family protein [Oscillospiraceae bacterium]
MSINNTNEELKNNIIKNLNSLKEKKLNKNKTKPEPVKTKKPKHNITSETKERPEKTGKKNKPAGLDKSISDRLNKLSAAKKTAAVIIEPEEAEFEEIAENKIDYTEFIQNQNAIEIGEEKHEIVGVRFKPVGKIYYFLPKNNNFQPGDKVIVETSRGLELGNIVFSNRVVSAKKVVLPLKPILRPASDEDIKRVERNKISAVEALKIAEERIKEHGLKMKLIDAEYTFDNSKLIYCFAHEGRVDFRELLKDLAAIFRVRIELIQIGIRDQTKVLGGLSVCGRPFCCSSFLQSFEQVTIKMAKDQNISINSAKISGACGKLMCCLKYEHETYEQLNKDIPRTGALVETSEGESGVVIESNALTGMCRVKITRALNKRGDSAENVIKPYSKKQLKIIGFTGKEPEPEPESAEEVSAEPDIIKV